VERWRNDGRVHFSPDGKHIVSAPTLWTATSYCPSIELGKDLLGVFAELAAHQLAECQARVAATR
jgi:hypothetical protein